VGVQISVTGTWATAGTTQAPNTPCNAENAAHNSTQRSQSAWRGLRVEVAFFIKKLRFLALNH
jgi:hypothetical protein